MINLTKKAGINLSARHRAERRLQWTGRSAIIVSLLFLTIMVARLPVMQAAFIAKPKSQYL